PMPPSYPASKMPGSGLPVPGAIPPASAVVHTVLHCAQWFLSSVRSTHKSPASELHFVVGFAHEPSTGLVTSGAEESFAFASLELASAPLASGSSTTNFAHAANPIKTSATPPRIFTSSSYARKVGHLPTE